MLNSIKCADKTNNKMIGKLFFNMLPVQILIFAMGSVNSIVDGVMAGRFIDASTVGVIGLYYSMVNIINAAGSVLLGGSAVLCGRFMGKGDMEKTEGVFSLNMAITFIIGLLLTIVSFLFPGQLAVALGSNDELKSSLVTYIVGYAIGILPMLFAQQIASFLQLERQNLRGYIGIAGMTGANIFLDILLVGIMKMGILGLALATSFSNIVYFLILVPYYFTKKAQLRFAVKKILWDLSATLLKIGLPGALLVFFIAIRGIVINRILLRYAGNNGLSAMSAFNMICGILIAYCLGNGAVVRMLISVFAGEEDKDSISQLFRILFTRALLMSCFVAMIIVMLAMPLANIFFSNRNSEVFHLTHQLFVIYGLCIPLILICQINANYLQAMGHAAFVNFLSVFDGFFAMVIPAAVLAPVLGAFGVWIANPIGIILTILTVPVYRLVYFKRLPKSVDDFMFFREDFGVAPEDSLLIPIRDREELTMAASAVQEFCEGHEINKRVSYYTALCLEEIAGNVLQHGFSADKKNHSLNVRVINFGDRIMLRIKDDCIPFNPEEIARMVQDEDGAFDNIGIRMVYKIADDVNYQNLLGLNVLTITIHEQDLMKIEKTDYLLERTLARLDPDLHGRFRDTVFIVQSILSRYKLLFPEFTDHTELHSFTVIDACNRLIGRDQVDRLNKDEIYILLMGCYLHDTGMGISMGDFDEFKDRLDKSDYFEMYPDATIADFVRDRHNEFSGFFIEKYADLFEFPSSEYVFAVKQVARGHRKTDLFDEKEYPADFRLPNGNTVCLPYLAALLRLADEIDVVATRNPILLYDMGAFTREKDIVENKKLEAVKSMMMTGEAFVLSYETDEEKIAKALDEMAAKMQKTLDMCRRVINERTDYKLSQKKIVLVRIQGDKMGQDQ
ncbi:MAG: ATP-binding protein [Lachnospiraceae bacterium]|nr:ATP-binding protein [Lachnospiraceae bacterium]